MKKQYYCAIILSLVTLACYGQGKSPIRSGLGIVEIADTYDESKVVTVYRDKDFKEKIEDFKLYAPLKRISPYYFKPDYGLCSFVCLEKTKDYFKVLINDKEEGFLKIDSDKYFKTWEALLINSTVERLDIESNPIKAEPGDHHPSIRLQNVKADRLEVIEAIEVNGQYWINVRFSKSGEMPCAPDCGTGWIKWKSGDKLLVNILRLC